MRKFILPVLLCFIFINPATANDEIKSLLKTLDKALKYKLDYAEQKQEQIDSLKIELKLHHKIHKKVQIAELLCFAYSSFQKDSTLSLGDNNSCCMGLTMDNASLKNPMEDKIRA